MAIKPNFNIFNIKYFDLNNNKCILYFAIFKLLLQYN